MIVLDLSILNPKTWRAALNPWEKSALSLSKSQWDNTLKKTKQVLVYCWADFKPVALLFSSAYTAFSCSNGNVLHRRSRWGYRCLPWQYRRWSSSWAASAYSIALGYTSTHSVLPPGPGCKEQLLHVHLALQAADKLNPHWCASATNPPCPSSLIAPGDYL